MVADSAGRAVAVLGAILIFASSSGIAWALYPFF